MRDRDVRCALHDRLSREHSHDPDTRVLDELSLCGHVRVDVAVVNGYLAAYELKSARDTLRRLPIQVDFYSKVADFSSVVVAENHVAAVQDLVPAWWGLTVATGTGGIVCLEDVRSAEANPSVNAHYLVQLLWRDEMLAALEAIDEADGIRSKPRRVLGDLLADRVSLTELRDLVRDRLKHREGWRVPAP